MVVNGSHSQEPVPSTLSKRHCQECAEACQKCTHIWLEWGMCHIGFLTSTVAGSMPTGSLPPAREFCMSEVVSPQQQLGLGNSHCDGEEAPVNVCNLPHSI